MWRRLRDWDLHVFHCLLPPQSGPIKRGLVRFSTTLSCVCRVPIAGVRLTRSGSPAEIRICRILELAQRPISSLSNGSYPARSERWAKCSVPTVNAKCEISAWARYALPSLPKFRSAGLPYSRQPSKPAMGGFEPPTVNRKRRATTAR
jgi:hypothetical protein